MGFLKRTLLASGLAALLLAPGVITVSEVASADDAADTVVVAANEGTPDVNTPDVTTGDDATGNGDGTTTDPGTSVNPQPSASPSSDPQFTDDQCSISKDGDTQRCVNDKVAKSGTVAPETSSKSVAPKAKANVKANASAPKPQSARPASSAVSPMVAAPVRATVASALSAASDEIDAKTDIVEHQSKEAPNLPVTGSTENKKSTGANTTSAALIIDEELALASSRASLLAFAACGAFAIVAAASVVTARRLMPR